MRRRVAATLAAMKLVLILCAAAGLLWTLLSIGNATSAIQEIEGGIGFLIATVAFGAIGVINAIGAGRPKPPQMPKS